jgi:prepilin peptidase CpaA
LSIVIVQMPLIALLQVICLVLLAVLLVGAAAQDMRTMHIANGFSLAIVALFAIFATAGLVSGRTSVSSVGITVACAALVFAAGAAAFAAGALGGGDVKLLASVSLFAGATRLPDFLAITALMGGVLAIAILAGAPIGQPAGGAGAATLRARLRGGVPYGPAIAAGGLWLAASLGSS